MYSQWCRRVSGAFFSLLVTFKGEYPSKFYWVKALCHFIGWRRQNAFLRVDLLVLDVSRVRWKYKFGVGTFYLPWSRANLVEFPLISCIFICLKRETWQMFFFFYSYRNMNTIFFKSRLTSSWENFNCCRFRSSRFAVLAVLFFFFPYFWFHEDIAYNEKEDCFIHTINKPSFSQSQRSFDLVSLSLLPFHTYPKQNVFLLGHTGPLI